MDDEGEVTLHLVAGDNSAAVDVVFFHGLGGHHEKTWCYDQGFSWPNELANEAAGVRVWSLAYPAYRWCWTAQSKEAVGDIKQISRSVRAEIASKQIEGLMQSGKPCIWVCHSLGGLVAKRLLVDSQGTSDAGDQIHHECLQGIMFLGTPHRGSGFADWGNTLVDVAKKAGQSALSLLVKKFGWVGPVPDNLPGHLSQFVKELENRNDGLWDLDGDFKSYFESRWESGKKPLFVSVLAEGRSPFPGGIGPLVVDKTSADPRLRTSINTDPVEPIVMSGLDHFELSKPVSKSSPQFRYLLDLRYRVCSKGGRYAAYVQETENFGDQAVFHLQTQLDQQFYSDQDFLGHWCGLDELKNPTSRLQPDEKIVAIVRRLARNGDVKNIAQHSMAMATTVLKSQHKPDAKLRKHVDAVVAELLVYCAAPRERVGGQHAVSHQGYKARNPDVDPLYLRASQAQHKSIPAILPSGDGVLALEDLNNLEPTISPVDALEQWIHGPTEEKTLREFATQLSAVSKTQSDDDFKQGLETQVAQRIQDRGYLVVDARDTDVKQDLLDQFDRSPVLPILSIILSSSENCEVEASLRMAWNNYSEARTKHLHALDL